MTASVGKIAKIRTGGQSGVDRAAMDFAIEHGIPYCGWCPKGGWAEDYPDPPGLLRDYPELQETSSSGTEQRTKWNMREAMRQACRYACMSDHLPNAVTPSTKYEVRDADAILTIIPESSAKSQGTEVGLEEGEHLGKPMFTASGMKDVPEIRRWISTLPNGIELCVGGPRASECPEAYKIAKTMLCSVIDNDPLTERWFMPNTTKETLWRILDLFEGLSVTCWLDGGWGVDALYGKQTRDHRDIDINFDAAKTQDVLTALQDLGYMLDTDWLPVRAEFSHPEMGFLDIHPFVIEEGTVQQANPEGGYWVFPPEFFGTTVFEGRVIPCISLEGQKVFHSGYEPREKDLHDIRILNMITK